MTLPLICRPFADFCAYRAPTVPPVALAWPPYRPPKPDSAMVGSTSSPSSAALRYKEERKMSAHVEKMLMQEGNEHEMGTPTQQQSFYAVCLPRHRMYFLYSCNYYRRRTAASSSSRSFSAPTILPVLMLSPPAIFATAASIDPSSIRSSFRNTCIIQPGNE